MLTAHQKCITLSKKGMGKELLPLNKVNNEGNEVLGNYLFPSIYIVFHWQFYSTTLLYKRLENNFFNNCPNFLLKIVFKAILSVFI